MSRTSTNTQLMNNLSENVKGRILNPKVSKEILNKFKEKEKQEVVKVLTDLRDIKSKSESEVYEILNAMVKNNQFFMYCGSLLLNINPGPDCVRDYLNLQTWVKETESKDEGSWKPHLYSFMYYVYQTMVSEKKDQVVNMLGQIGSGKTFNIIHIIEYFCCMVGPEGYQIEVFDKIHKSIQLIHIMGSIFRENNLESTSCGILLRLGFGQDNKICTFDIDSKILDCTLPFSENGRSFSILHSFIASASSDLKRSFNLPENEIHLNFFRKFSNNFSNKTKQAFKLNDYEIWNRFHSLLHSFGFQKQEVIEILQIFSFIIMVNEIGTTKNQEGTKSVTYSVMKGHCSKKLAKNLNINEDELIKCFGSFKDLSEVKNTLICLIKYSYYIVFEYIQKRIKESLKEYFNSIANPSQTSSTINKKNNTSNNLEGVKYINFLDFPGEVDDTTLGGLLTNLGNECINLYAGNSYLSVVEKLIEENVNMKLFPPLHCYNVVRSLMGDKGLLNYLSLPFTEENFTSLQKEVRKQPYYKECLSFLDNNNNKPGKTNDFKFKINFSSKNITYDYESLYQEIKSITNTSKILKIFSSSKNSIIKSTYQEIIEPKVDFFKYAYNNIMSLFKPIEGYSPFVIYCLHSNNSHKLFFDKKDQVNILEKDWVIPRDLTMSLLKKSLCIPILFWEWFGYSEWIETDTFLKDFSKDFERIEPALPKTKDVLGKVIIFSQLNTIEKVSYIINNLVRNCDYAQGRNYIVMKKGTLARIQDKIKTIIEEMQSNSKREILKNCDSKISKTSKTMSKKPITKNLKDTKSLNTKNISKGDIAKKKEMINQTSTIKESHHSSKSQLIIERRNTMKTQCNLNIIDNKSTRNSTLSAKTSSASSTRNQINNDSESPSCSKYNVYRIFDHTAHSLETINKSESEEVNVNQSLDDTNIDEYRKKNNIVIPNKNCFTLLQNLLAPSKNKNYKIFDYSNFEPDIIRIQCLYRVKKAKENYLILRYISTKIIIIQANTRRFITMKKFEKFQKCLQSILFIQKVYRIHYRGLITSARKIQAKFRQRKLEHKVPRKLERHKESQMSEEDYMELFNKDKKEQIEMLEEARKMKSKIQSVQKIKKKVKKEPKKYLNISNENDNSKIVSLILKDRDLMKENEALNRRLVNQRGVNKGITYELLNIEDEADENNVPKKKIEDKLIEYGEVLKQKRAQEKVDKLKMQEMQYSFRPQIQKSQRSYNKNKELYSKTIDIANKDFYSRAAFFEETKENRIEHIKTTIVDPEKSEYTFKPKLSNFSKNIKRTIDDLYKWKEKTEKKRQNQQKKKEDQEKEERNRNNLTSYVNDKSKAILEKKNRQRNMATINNSLNTKSNIASKTIEIEGNPGDCLEYDLWPTELNKLYS